MSRTVVPITPAVLEWAVNESGLTAADVAASAGVDERTLERWLVDAEKPNLTEMRKIASKLHRQLAVFLLPAPPPGERVDVSFRHPIGIPRFTDLYRENSV